MFFLKYAEVFFLLSLNLVFGGKGACVIASKWG